MLYEFGYNNTKTLVYILKALRERNIIVDIFYTGADIVNTGRLTGNSTIEEIHTQKIIIKEYFPNAKLFVVLNDCVLSDFDKKNTISSIKLLIEEAKPEGLIIANPILLLYLNDYLRDSNIEVVISTITNLDNVEKVEKLIMDGIYFTGVVTPISINRDFNKLKSIKQIIGKRSLAIIPNESCSPHCVNRQFHFIAHSTRNIEFSNRFVEECSRDISENPINVLMSGMLGPSTILNDYGDIIDILKLPNRHLINELEINRSIDRLDSYSTGKDPIDFFSLLSFNFKYSIPSSKLQDLFKIWKGCKNNCHSCNSCMNYAKYIKQK